MIEVSVTQYPKKEIVATCRTCGMELKRRKWDTYSEYQRLSFSMKHNCGPCPHCKQASLPKELKWEKHYDIYGRITKDWEAKTVEGDFLIWRHGRIWKARYRNMLLRKRSRKYSHRL